MTDPPQRLRWATSLAGLRAGRWLSAPVAPEVALAHPAWWASLFTLLVNDHVLKGSKHLAPWVTGKLSDFAGLFLAPLLLSTLLRVKSRRGLLLCHCCVAAAFLLLKTWQPARDVCIQGGAALGLRLQIVADITDLYALSSVLVSFAWLGRVSIEGNWTLREAWRKSLVAAGMALGIVGTVATSELPPPHPVVTPKDVYVASLRDSYLHVLDPSTGVERRSFQVPNLDSSPEIYGDTLIVREYSGSATAYDVGTGTQRWSKPSSGPAPVGYYRTDNTLLERKEKSLTAYEATSGQLRWSRQETVGLPVSDGSVVVVGDTEKYVLLGLDIRDGRERWRTPMPENLAGVPEIRGSRLLVLGLRRVYSLDLSTGRLLASSAAFSTIPFWPDTQREYVPVVNAWGQVQMRHGQNTLGPNRPFPSTAVIGAAWTIPGREELLSLDPTTLRVLWNRPDFLPVTSNSDSVFATRRSDGDKLYALDDVTGTVLWSIDCPLGIHKPIQAGDAVVVIQDQEVVVGIDPGTGRTLWRRTLALRRRK